MGDFKHGGGKRFGGGRGGGFGGRDRGPVTMHRATCAECGQSCEVPFRPTEGKPVYCNACFGGKKETGAGRGGDRFPQKSFSSSGAPVRTDDGSKKQLEILNAKMDRLIQAVEAMAGARPAVAGKKAKKPVKKVSKKAKK